MIVTEIVKRIETHDAKETATVTVTVIATDSDISRQVRGQWQSLGT